MDRNEKRGADRRLVKTADIPSVVPLDYTLSSRGRPHWPVTVDVRGWSRPFIGAGPAFADHQIVLQLGYSSIYQRAGGQEQQGDLQPGDIGLLPAGLETFWDSSPGTSAGIYLPPQLLTEAYEQSIGRVHASLSLPNLLQKHDEALRDMTRLLVHEVSRPEHPGQLLLVESLTTAMCLHLLRDYVQIPLANPSSHDRSTRSIQAVVDYIEDCPADTRISLAELAELAGISRFHFGRLFKKALGSTPMHYVEQRRLKLARDMILQGSVPLAQIALAVGFADQSHFTRRFKAHFGNSPAAFARQHCPYRR